MRKFITTLTLADPTGVSAMLWFAASMTEAVLHRFGFHLGLGGF